MSRTLLDTFHARMGDRFVRVFSGMTNEYAGDTQIGADIAIQSVIDMLVRRTSAEGGLKPFFQALRPVHRLEETVQAALGPEESPDALRALLDSGASLSAALFGRDESDAIDRIAGHAGLKTSSAAILLRLATAVTWSLVRPETGDKPGARTLAAFLQRQLPLPANIFPPYETRYHTLTRMEHQPSSPQSPETKPSGVRKLLPWIALVLLTLILLYFVQRGCGSTGGENESAERTVSAGQFSGTTGTTTDTLDPYAKFPKGFEVLVSSTGMPTPTHCFVLDKVTFKPETATLTSDSDAQLEELLGLMNKYSYVVLGLECHSVISDDETKNEGYSWQKCESIKLWLLGKGLPEDRVLTTAWGSRNPRYKDGSEASKRLNERVEACVVSKELPTGN
jgi:outer membrane protein OmpA-like peptidoglycan-associated protein